MLFVHQLGIPGKNRFSINDSPHTMTSDFLNFGNPAAVDFLSIGLLD